MAHFSLYYILIVTITVILNVVPGIDAGALQLDSTNFDQIIGNNDVVFINFYADWCRFSNLLAPTWDEAADKVKEQNPEEGQVIIGKVDCDKETSISSRFHITKYPTLKLLRNGQASKREYRGQRSVDSIAEFISEQLKSPVKVVESLDELQKIEDKRTVFGYFDTEEVAEFVIFKKVATNLKEDCQFYAGVGEGVRSIHPPGESLVVFKSSIGQEEETFTGTLTSYDELSIWATERCIPIVREITFQNAEELTEEGLPFLILFHAPDDKESIIEYTKLVQKDLLSHKPTLNFLTADGVQFAHPLHHLGKSKSDLPLLAIDSFRHMYLFPDYKDIAIPGKLDQFLQDLYSGKLHREFHYGPDKDESTEAPQDQTEGGGGGGGQQNNDESTPTSNKRPTTPPESTFKKLAPSKNRYTLLSKDEL